MRVETSEGFIVSSRLFFLFLNSLKNHSLFATKHHHSRGVGPRAGSGCGTFGEGQGSPPAGLLPCITLRICSPNPPRGFSIAREKAFSIDFPS